MRIAVFGAGGVGGYFGGRLAQAGEDVIFIARGEHLKAIRSRGLQVDSIEGDFLIRPAHAADDPSQAGAVDAVLVCVKAWQVPEIAPRMRSMLGVDSLVVPLCNGVEAPEQLADALGTECVLGGVCRISAFIVEPGHVRHAGIEPSVAFGRPDGQPDPRVERLRQAFEQAGVKAETPTNIRAAMWEKFLFIAAVSGLGAVTRASIGAIRSTPETRRLLEQALQEIATVARAKGIDLPENIAPRTMAFIDTLPPGITPSMQRDIENKRPSELEAQNGAVVRMGLETGTPTPVHKFIYHSLLPQELHARGSLYF